ncbi:MAG: glutamate-5-semialdehyde dehydrogenase [Anaerolineales bacterium]
MTIDMQELGRRAKAAARAMRPCTTDDKNSLLAAIADALEAERAAILAANAQDVQAAQERGLAYAMVDRLRLDKRLDGVIADVRSVIELPDPVGQVFYEREVLPGLQAHRRRVPIGVLGVIYESRPNVTVDISSLALKTGNAVILRGGSETLHSNQALVSAIQAALQQSGFPADAIQLIQDTDRRYVAELLRLDAYVDMIIPRGGAKLHQMCKEQSTIPVITGGMGICHLYVDETAELDAALDVIHNAKVQRPSACNALGTLLVQRSIAETFVPRVVERLAADEVTIKLDPALQDHVTGYEHLELAQAGDWDVEWLDYILGIRVVDGLDEAIEHIETHGTAHSDGILTRDSGSAERFLNEVDSAALYVNASTRFTDGGALGLGAEVAVSTQKLHARGPMALEELTTYKWIVQGQNHIRPG